MSEIGQQIGKISQIGSPGGIELPSGEVTGGMSSVGEGFGEIVAGARDILADGLQGASAFGGLQMPTELFGLIEMQRQLQLEMETVSMISNIEKSRHESRMTAVRNMRTN